MSLGFGGTFTQAGVGGSPLATRALHKAVRVNVDGKFELAFGFWQWVEPGLDIGLNIDFTLRP